MSTLKSDLLALTKSLAICGTDHPCEKNFRIPILAQLHCSSQLPV